MKHHAETTVTELMALIDRTAKSLAEVGETRLSQNCHIRVTRDGVMSLNFEKINRTAAPGSEVVEKAMSLDPLFKTDSNPQANDGGDHE